MASAGIPNFKRYADGETIPPVDPEDLKRRWNIKSPWTGEALQAANKGRKDGPSLSNAAIAAPPRKK